MHSLCLIGHFFLEKVPAFFQWCICRSDEAWQNTLGCRCCLLHFGISEKLPEKLLIECEILTIRDENSRLYQHDGGILILNFAYLSIFSSVSENIIFVSELHSPMLHVINESGHLTIISVLYRFSAIFSTLICSLIQCGLMPAYLDFLVVIWGNSAQSFPTIS